MGKLPSVFSDLEHQSLCCSFYFNGVFCKDCKELMKNNGSKKEASNENNDTSGEESEIIFVLRTEYWN